VPPLELEHRDHLAFIRRGIVNKVATARPGRRTRGTRAPMARKTRDRNEKADPLSRTGWPASRWYEYEFITWRSGSMRSLLLCGVGGDHQVIAAENGGSLLYITKRFAGPP
jgi:hypothetical protein